MNFRDLEYLVAVVEEGHFGRAAARCHVSQSALSVQLGKLERELGVQLVERTTRRVLVTGPGREVVERVRGLLRARNELLDHATTRGAGLPAVLRIGLIPTVAPYLLGCVRGALGGSEGVITEEVTATLVRQLAEGMLDAAILATPSDDTLLEDVVLFEEPFLLAVPEGHRLATRSRVEARELGAERLLLLKDGHCMKDQSLAFCTARGITGERVSAASSIETLCAMVRAGCGVSLIPAMACAEPGRWAGIRCVRLSPAPSRRILVVVRRTARHRAALVKAMRVAAQTFRAGNGVAISRRPG